MQYFVAVLILIFAIGLGVSSCNDKKAQENAKPEIETSKVSTMNTLPELTGMDGINYFVKNLPDDIVIYLQTKSQYKNLYSPDKKLVIYYVGADCPYAKAFTDAIDPLTSNSKYTIKYNFYPQNASGIEKYDTIEEAQTATNFSNTCQEFCIVNPSKNQIFAINGIGVKEAAKIPEILDQLSDW